MSKILGYWRCRGEAQSIRYMLEYQCVEYEDKLYDEDEDYHCNLPPWDSQQCNSCDPECDVHFEEVTLPYYIDDGLLIIGRSHIINHIALRHQLLGSDDAENDAVKNAEAEAFWMRRSWDNLVHQELEEFELSKFIYRDELDRQLEKLSKMIGEIWFSGITLTFVDFILYEEISINQTLFPDCLENYENLREFVARFENLSYIEPYMNSDRFFRNSINDPDASWHGPDV